MLYNLYKYVLLGPLLRFFLLPVAGLTLSALPLLRISLVLRLAGTGSSLALCRRIVRPRPPLSLL